MVRSTTEMSLRVLILSAKYALIDHKRRNERGARFLKTAVIGLVQYLYELLSHTVGVDRAAILAIGARLSMPTRTVTSAPSLHPSRTAKTFITV